MTFMGCICSTYAWMLPSKTRKASASAALHPHTSLDNVFPKSSPETQQGFSYLGNVEQKLTLIKKIGGLYDEHLFADLKQGIFWSMLWTHDARFLQEMIRKLENPDTRTRFRFIETELMASVEAFPKLLHLFRGGHLDDLNDPRGIVPDAGDSSCPPNSSKGQRDPKVPKQAKQRDGSRCVLLGTADPLICHIFPFAAERRHNSVRSQLRSLKSFLDPQVWRGLILKLGLPSNEVDSLSNVLSLNRQLHKYWADGLFALEPLGAPTFEELPEDHFNYDNGRDKEDPQEHENRTSKKRERAPQKQWCLKLRFHWMKQTDLSSAQEQMEFDTDPRDHWDDPGNIYDHYNVKTSRRIQDGHIIEVFADNKYELPDWEILQLQWYLITTWSLIAGADPVDYKFPGDEDFEYLGGTSVSEIP